MPPVANIGRRHRVDVRRQLGIFVLPDPFHVRAELRLRRHLIREAREHIAYELTLNRGIAHLERLVRHFVVRVGDAFVDRHVTRRAEEPELVADDRSAHVEVEVLHVLNEVAIQESSRPERIVVVVALPSVRGAAEEAATLERVAAVLRDHVDAHASGRDFGRQRAGLEHDLLREGIVVVRLDVAVAHRAVDDHAVDLHARVPIVSAMRPHVRLFHALRAADVGTTQLDAGNRRADRLHVPRRRQRVEHGALEHVRALRVLHVDEWRLA